MVHLTNTSRSATFLLGTAMLMLFFFCAPMHAQSSQGFKSTSSYKIANPNYSAQQLDPTTIGHQAYRSTIYTPFGSGTPSSNNPSGNNGSGGSGDPNDDVGIPGWADTPSEPLPIGDGTLFLLLLAAIVTTTIAIKQRKQQLQSITTTNNNNNTTQMTTRKQTYQSLRQKLFLLLAFVCVAGQVSAEKKTIYFRPSTVGIDNGYAGSWGLTSAKTAHNVSWAKRSSAARFLVLERKSDGTYAEYSDYKLAANILPSATNTTAKYSRFIPTELDATSSFAIYRMQNEYSNVETSIKDDGCYNCIPNNEWWNSNGTANKGTMLISMSDLEDCNMVAIREGYWATGRDDKWKGYYFGYYLEEDAHIYFENKNDWTAPTFLRSKDIYAYTHDLAQIKGTNLWYCKLAKPTDVESGIAYTQYAFISNRTTKTTDQTTFKTDIEVGVEDPYLWKRFPHNTDDNTDLARGNRDKHDFSSLRNGKNYTETITKDKLSGKTNLYIPGAEDGAKVDKQTLGSWQDLNHTQTVIVETGGKLNYQTTKLTGEGARDTYSATDQTGTVTFTAAYTATTILRAKPIDGYYFLGFFDETGELLTRGEKMTDAEGGYVYRYQAPNAPKTIKARFTPIKQVCIQYPTNASWTAWETESIGNILKINYTDLTGNPVEFTFDKYPTENISEDVYITNDSYRRIYIKNIDIDRPLTFTATEDNDHTFIGWRYNTVRFADNPWTVSDKSGNAFTARFVKFLQHTINVQTYNKEQNKYVLSEDGGSVEITYNKLDHTQVGDFDRKYKTNVSPRDTYSIPSNTSVTLTATPKDGYSFVGWYEGQNLASKELIYTYTATEARNITAYFAEGTGTTILDVRAMIHNGTALEESLAGGTFTMTHSGGIVYEHNTVGYVRDIPVSVEPVTFFATPNDGYEFIGWFNNEAGQFPYNPWIMLDPSDTGTGGKYKKSVSAVFASPNYVVKQDIKIEGPGTVTANYLLYPKKDNQNRTFNHNFSFNAWKGEYDITLTANPLAGYEFDGWYDAEDKPINDGVTGNTLTYKATSAHTITAKFKSEVNKLSVSVLNYNPEYDKFEEYGYEYNTVTLTQGSTKLKESYSSFEHTFNEETTVTLTATPEEGEDGYDFVGWYINDEKLTKAGSNSLYTLASDDSKVLTINLSGEVAVNARFAPKKCWKVTLDANAWGKYTLHYSKDRNFSTFQSIESSYTQPIYTYVPYKAFVTVSSVQPIHGYKCLRYKRGGSTAEIGTPIQCSTNNHNIQVEIVREEEQVVYLNLRGAEDVLYWSPTNDPNKYAYYAYVDNEFYSSDIKRKWIKMEHVNDYCYKCTISPANRYNKVNFVQIYIDANGNPITKEGNAVNMSLLDGNETYSLVDIRDTYKVQKTRSGATPIPATRHNCYRLNWFWNSSTQKNENAWTTPPTATGDYRLIYIEQEVASKTEITRTYEFIDGDRIKKTTSDTKLDTVSLHIYNKVSKDNNGNLTGTALNNPEIILQQWDGTAWVDVERHMVFGPLQTDNTGHIRMPGRKNTAPVVDLGIDVIKAEKENATKDYGSGVWNFVIEQNGSSARLVINQTHRYEGTYYIRTPNADGQYNNFTHPGNILSYSEYAKNNSDYSHYFIRYVDIYEDGTPTAEAGKHPVVKFCVANDYAINLCKEFTNTQNRFEPEEDIYVLNAGDLPADASVRFGWDIKTNRLTRAYIANTFHKNNEYLVVEGTNIGSPTGEATYFNDNSNYLYSIDLNATKNAATKVKAKYNGQYQYFLGTEQANETLISGNGANTYPIRLLYDFKDDRFTTIYRPNASLSGTVNLETPVMIEREHNYAPTQITFNSGAKIQTLGTFDQPAYAVMTFLEEKLANASITHHEKMFYWISFPFDVCIRDVFGLGEYGKYWIMEEYDGAQRAAQGLAQSNWKYITKKSTVLSKNVGYVLCLNYSQILQDKLFSSYGKDDNDLNDGKLSLYFPSNGIVDPKSIVGGQNATIDLAEYYNANTAWNHHNWHIIGVPSFANPGTIDEQQDAPFVYQYWHPGDAYAAVSIYDVEFQSMHAYMVQYAGKIKWTNKIVNTGGNVDPKFLAAKTDEEADKNIMLRLELQQAGSTLDKTYVQLRNDKGTKGFDMSLDLTKIINAGANIYSIVDNHEMAGNAIPKEETVLPLGVVITAAGDYTFAMPQGTEGIMVELIDYEQGTCTNLLVGDYTVNMPVGTNNTRFALRLKPDKVATSVEDITSGNNDNVRKLLIDGTLYLQKGNTTYDAQGKHVQ